MSRRPDLVDRGPRDPRDPDPMMRLRRRLPEIDARTGRRAEVDRPVHGVVEAINDRPMATRVAWRLTYQVRGEVRERDYLDAASEFEARTCLARDEPDAYGVMVASVELPVE